MKNKLADKDIDAVQAQCLEEVWEPFPGNAVKEQFGRGDEE